ncbi:F-box/FBD/LRR-repeat protein At1g13570-like isoform X1 [Vicia villosa]|uniref:F-box/FBD/LRR-repeat protein At1g13570-like isoform X1 n=1 Tax=Vicia villosa TaxID=3911 RepID=UPI00273AE208|nr:F-box/FBD/LRR-repeat protein At1g13570-like isoform X1 [Vicia villosa]
MTLLNKKANQNDRISDLPSNVIDEILENLKIRDQVRTSILSRKWRYMWTSVPHLCFDNDFFRRHMHGDDPYPLVYKIITHVLMLHNGPIHKFSIARWREYEFPISIEKLIMWIPFMSNNIKHLELLTYCAREDENQMPDILFSCKELTYFKLSSFNLYIPHNFYGFKKLLELHLDCIEIESSALESFMSACPFLEKLNLDCCSGCDNLVISSPSLKVLVLELIDTESVCLKKAVNLIDFTLTACRSRVSIISLPKIKRFSLDGWDQHEDIVPATLLTSSFSSLEYLKLGGLKLNERGELLHIVSILKSAPSLVKLNIKIFPEVNTTQMMEHSKELECCSCFPKLQTVNVIISVGASSEQHTLSLIKFILANSASLKTLTFYFCSRDKLDAPMLLKVSQDFLRMERASPRAQVNFLQTTFGRKHLII